MKVAIAAAVLLLLASEAVACKPAPAPPGIQHRSSTPEEAHALAPFVAVGVFVSDSDELLRARGFRFIVERWVKGAGPKVLYVRGPFYSRHSRLSPDSCMIETPIREFDGEHWEEAAKAFLRPPKG